MVDEVRRRGGSGLRKAFYRVKDDAWPLLQSTAAATLAWFIALAIGDHPDPFFAPIAAVIAMNAERGQRGINALRLLTGVFIGIIAAEATLLALGGGYGRLALAVLLATVAARALGGARIVMAQAASAAILTVATAGGEGGIERLIDAAIGAGVALVFTQVLFSPEPVALLRRAEANALASLAEGLRLTAAALERDDDGVAEDAVTKLREVRDDLSSLAEVRDASERVVRHSVVWRSRTAPVVHEVENAGHLDLLVTSCVMLVRAAIALEPAESAEVATSVKTLAEAVAELAGSPGDKEVRQQAAETALDLVRSPVFPGDRSLAAEATSMALLTVATDLMVFAGVDQEMAAAAVEAGTGELPVAAPPPARRFPFRFKARLPFGKR